MHASRMRTFHKIELLSLFFSILLFSMATGTHAHFGMSLNMRMHVHTPTHTYVLILQITFMTSPVGFRHGIGL